MARERVLKVTILGDSASAERAFSRLQRSTQSMSQKMGQFGRTMSTRVTLPLLAMGGAAFKASSDLSESLNKANVIFGKNAAVVRAWSKTTGEAFGISQAEALETSASFGAMLETSGVVGKEMADMSMRLVELAADMGSFNNQDPSEMLERLRSGLAGEAEPLRRFGVFLSEARVQQEAVNMGLAEQGDQLTDQQKVLARYNLILQDTQKQQGDFARTSDSAANQQRILMARLNDIAGFIGKNLLPIGNKLIGWVQKLLDWFSNLSSGGKKVVLIIGGIAAAIGPLLTVLAALAKAVAVARIAFVALMSHPIVAAIAAITAAVVLLVQNWHKVRPAIANAFRGVGAFIDMALGPIDELIAKLVRAIGLMQQLDVFNSTQRFAQGFVDTYNQATQGSGGNTSGGKSGGTMGPTSRRMSSGGVTINVNGGDEARVRRILRDELQRAGRDSSALARASL